MAHDAKFGALIDEHQQRDAIHVAIAPVIATERLYPGDHVGLVDDTEHVGKTAPGITPIGIIDPFLRGKVERGERCWLLLYQQTITSLRHEWTHPAFAEVPKSPSAAPSREWIRSFAEGHSETYQSIMEAARAFVERGEYFSKGGKFEGEWVPDEFWTHYQIVTGTLVDNKESFFSCAC